jgi:cyanophycin synthetase
MAEGGARCRQIEIVLEELDAVRHCMARANPGDLVVLCVDHHATVLGELEQLTSSAQAGAHEGTRPGDPDLNPRALQDAAEVSGAQAAAGER